MNGREDEALATLRRDRAALSGFRGGWPPVGPNSLLGDGGLRYLLARQDLAGARAWLAGLTASGLPGPDIENQASAILAFTSWTQVMDLGLHPPNRQPVLSDGIATALDLLPADRLVGLARTPGLPPTWRRPMLGAAWIRYEMLGRTADFLRLFPQVRVAFPELAGDLDQIDRAWLPWTRARLITRMLLRLPGLTPRVLWNRGAPDGFGFGRATLFVIDPNNPNDGNWWCPPDPQRARLDAFANMGAPLTRDWNPVPSMFISLWLSGRLSGDTPTTDQLAAHWLALSPLLRGADTGELAALSKAQAGPLRLAREAVAWSRESWWLTRRLGLDRDLPETLALAVRATRYGCRRAGSLGPVSRAAWKALHTLYPHSEWTTRTPYWFDETRQPG